MQQDESPRGMPEAHGGPDAQSRRVISPPPSEECEGSRMTAEGVQVHTLGKIQINTPTGIFSPQRKHHWPTTMARSRNKWMRSVSTLPTL